MELMSIGRFANKIRVNVATVRRIESSGALIPDHVSSGGARYDATAQLKEFTHSSTKQKLVVGGGVIK